MDGKRLRAVVTEETYGVFAKVEGTEFRSDEIAAAMRISEQLRVMGRNSEIASGVDGTFVQLFLGDDAPEQAYVEAGAEMIEAASW